MKRVKFTVMTMLAMMIIFSSLSPAYARLEDGEYPVKVSLWKKYDNSKSMGNNALTPQAKVIVKDGKAKMKVRFIPLETMGFIGYLGELSVQGQPVKILSYYDDYDEYNDPLSGVDEKMKGRKYPKDMEFPFDPTKEFTDVTVYVPVMGSMGFGTQDARLRLAKEDVEKFQKMGGAIGKDPSKEESSPKESKGESEANATIYREQKPGLYQVPVQLWHAVEDKASMGNGALAQVAELEITDDGKNFLYIGSDTMEVQNIIASLVNLYYEDSEGNYKASERNNFELEIPDEVEKRPTVFKMPLRQLERYVHVMVDPKVEPMGDNPIKARLQLDLDQMKEISQGDAHLKKQFNEGTKKEAFQPNIAGKRQNKSIWVEFPKNTFDREFSFYGNKIMGEQGDTIKEQFDPLDTVYGYRIEFLGPLEEIKADEQDPQKTREKIQPKQEMTVKIPAKSLSEQDSISVYNVNGKKKKLKYQWKDGFIQFKTKEAGDFAIVKVAGGLSPLGNSDSGTKNSNSTPASRGQAFLNKVKKSSPQVVRNHSTEATSSGASTLSSAVSAPSTIQNSVGTSSVSDSADRGEETMGKEEITEQILPQERKGLIFLIIVMMASIIGISLYVIHKYIKLVGEELEEKKRLEQWRVQ